MMLTVSVDTFNGHQTVECCTEEEGQGNYPGCRCSPVHYSALTGHINHMQSKGLDLSFNINDGILLLLPIEKIKFFFYTYVI